MIKVLCYGKVKEYKSLKEAKDFFMDCCYASEGSEREHYMDILMQLLDGNNFVYDDENDYKEYLRNKEGFSYDS